MGRQAVSILCILSFLCSAPAFAQDSPVCSAEISFTNPKLIVNATDVLNLNLFSTVSNPSACFRAEIHISAAFYDVEENLICSGSLVLTEQNSNILSTNIEVRALNPIEFVRLVDSRRPAAKRLYCNNLEGNVEVGSTQMATANSLRLRATVLPRSGGVATTEARMTLRVSR